jgi:hypothetical protein
MQGLDHPRGDFSVTVVYFFYRRRLLPQQLVPK